MKNALSVSGGEIDESKNLPQLPQAIPTFIPAYQIIATGSFFSFKYTYTLKFLEKHTMLMYACISLCFSQKSHTSCNIKIASLSLSPTTVSPLESLPCHFQTWYIVCHGCIYHNLFAVYFPTNGHIGCFQFYSNKQYCNESTRLFLLLKHSIKTGCITRNCINCVYIFFPVFH